MKKSDLKNRIKRLEIDVTIATNEKEWAEEQLEKAKAKVESLETRIKALYKETEQMYHTPEFAADTASALDRGYQNGVRSMSQRVQNDILTMLNDMYGHMETIAHKYTRDLAVDTFLGKIEEAQDAVTLPDTEFTRKLVQQAIADGTI